jgi:propionyl-CoA carboxylase alpha chain
VRWESGVERGSVVTVAFDPLLAKVIAHAPTRVEAAATLARALERLHLGGVTTNRDFLVATLRDEHFLDGDTTTDFIERFDSPREVRFDDDELIAAASAGALWLQGERRAHATILHEVPSGWRNARLPRQRASLVWGSQQIDLEYAARRDGTFDLGLHGSARVHHWSELAIDLELNGCRRSSRVTRAGAHLYVQSLRGTVAFTIVPRFDVKHAEIKPGGLNAPMPGLVLEVRVEAGQRVKAGEALVVMEAMKMEHVISAASAGTVIEVLVTKNQQVESGVPLLTFDADDAANAE